MGKLAFNGQLFYTGYIPEEHDPNDRTCAHPDIEELLVARGKASSGGGYKAKTPKTSDLKAYFPPIYNQLSLNSCTAQASAALVTYFEGRAFGQWTQPSRLFIYRIARNFVYQPADLGSYMRRTFEALETVGAPPETHWPYDVSMVNAEPGAFQYGLAARFRVVRAFRYDGPDVPKGDVLEHVKRSLAVDVPSAFGFLVFESIQQAMTTGEIPLPGKDEKLMGAHAVAAVGYDDEREITNALTGDVTKGAFLIRNSWGTGWGDEGYGWMPYEMILQDFATDWWSLLGSDYIDLDQFEDAPKKTDEKQDGSGSSKKNDTSS